MKKLPRFLRTKHGVFTVYLFALVFAFSVFNWWLAFRLTGRISVAERRVSNLSSDVSAKVLALSDLKTSLERLLSSPSDFGGTLPAVAPDSDMEQAQPPEDRPQVLGIGQNGLYAYADIRYSDGTVLRHYQRLPNGLRRGTRP